MNTYGQLALTTNPVLYLGSPTTTDQSGSLFYSLSSNTLSPTGQPIVYGADSSFLIDSAHTVTIDGNPIFINDIVSVEFVVLLSRPTDIVNILVDSDGQNSISADQNGFTIKLYFQSSLITYSKSVSVLVSDWDKKHHVIVAYSDNRATLSVNDQIAEIRFDDPLIESSSVIVGGGYSGYSYLLDGLGFYTKNLENKTNFLDDPGSGYATYSGLVFDGHVTSLDGFISGYNALYTAKDFKFVANPDYYVITHIAAFGQPDPGYLIIRCNDKNAIVNCTIDNGVTQTFSDYLLVDISVSSTLHIQVPAGGFSKDTRINIISIYTADVLDKSPASLVLNGKALYPNDFENSIVNNPSGVKLINSTYTGTWIYGQTTPDIPSSIELVFKPFDDSVKTYVLNNSDGECSFGPAGQITNFTAYLNGVVVTDLTDIKLNQWNHLVLTIVSPAATSFYLNSSAGSAPTTTLSYMLLGAYQQVLTAQNVIDLFSVLCGTDKLSVVEPSIPIVEGVFDNGFGFNYYSFPWSIIGAGGR